jgi:hypothetical protein
LGHIDSRLRQGDIIFIYRSLSAQVLLMRTTAMEPKSGEIACLSKI